MPKDKERPDPNPEIKVTAEMRKAVYSMDCLEKGHVLDFMTAIMALSEVPMVIGGVSNLDENKLPHITCTRCESVWIIVPHSGADYDDAERFLYSNLNATTGLAKKIVRDKGERSKRPPELPLHLREP